MKNTITNNTHNSVTILAGMIAVALLVSLSASSELAFGSASGGGGTGAGYCDFKNPMQNLTDSEGACVNSGVGWIKYTFSQDFRDGILLYAEGTNKGKIVKDNGVVVTLKNQSEHHVENGKYGGVSVRELKMDDIWFGPGSPYSTIYANNSAPSHFSVAIEPGSGGIRNYYIEASDEASLAGLDECRKDSSGIFRSGYFEQKNRSFSASAMAGSSVPATRARFEDGLNNVSFGPYIGTSGIGVAGHQTTWDSSAQWTRRWERSMAVGSLRFAGGHKDDYGNVIPGTEEVYSYIMARDGVPGKDMGPVDQAIFYDNVVVMSAYGYGSIYDTDDYNVFRNYVTYAVETSYPGLNREQIIDVRSKIVSLFGNPIEGTYSQTIVFEQGLNAYAQGDNYNYLVSNYDRGKIIAILREIYAGWGSKYYFCYTGTSNSKYTADAGIGLNGEIYANTKGLTHEPIWIAQSDRDKNITASFFDIRMDEGEKDQQLSYGYSVKRGQEIILERRRDDIHFPEHRDGGATAADNSISFTLSELHTIGNGTFTLCAWVDYWSGYYSDQWGNYNPYPNGAFSAGGSKVHKEACVDVYSEIHSSILWSKIDLFARVGANSDYTVSADGNASCNTLWANFDPASTNVARTINADGLRISAAEAPVANGSGRYNWNSASNSGRCHIQSQRGKLPTRIVMRVSASRKAGIHEGDGADVLAGSDFSVNIGNGSGNDFSKNLSSMMDGGFTYTWNRTDGARKPHLAFSGESTNFVKLNDVDKSIYQVFPEQEIAANDTYTHPKIAKDMGNTNAASYRLEGQSNILTSSSSVNFSVVRDGFRCPDRFKDDSAYYYGIYNGRNLASVDFEISDGINTKSGAGGNAYAKPGQMVRFVYNMCAGGTYTHMARTSASGSIENSLGATWTDSANTHFTLKVEDTTGDGKDYSAGYLFGKIPFGYNNQDTTATFSTQGNSQNISSNVNFLKISNNQDQDTGVKFNADITQYSLRTPSGQNSEAAGKYSCNYGDISGPYYYHIGDGLGGICSKNGSDSIARRKEGWDLGRSFKESVTYTHLVYANGQKTDGPYDVTTDATINTPFNYKTNPSADISSIDNSYITAGDSLSVTANFNLEPITNDALTFYNNEAEKTYTTRSKSSLLVSFGFIVPAEGSNKSDLVNYYSSSKYVDNPDTGMTLDRLCEAAFPNNRYCASTTGEDEFGRRETLSLDGAAVDRSKTYILSENGSDVTEDGEKAYSWAFNGRKYEVPGEYSGRVGDVVCVVSAIYPANSYNLGINESSISANDSRLSNALSGEGAGDGAKWALSKPSCTTISKKPTFSVEGGSLFVAGNINTYNGIYRLKNEYVNDTYMYGSWSEYGITLGGLNRSMASGAGYGYGSTGGVTAGGSNTILQPNEGGKAFYRLPHVDDECALSSQTVSNAKCSEGNGNFGEGVSSEVIDKIKGQLDNTLSDLKARYKNNTLVSSTGAPAIRLSNGQAIADDDICYYDGAAGEYRTKNGVLGFCSSKGEQYFDINDSQFVIGNNLNFKFTDRNDVNANQRNRTIIIRINGTLMIDGDITIEDDGYSSIKQIPNVLIFAKNVEISDRVNRIDAWIIADNLFNTCAFKSSDYSFRYTKEDQLHAADCDNPLIINGPVSANKIKLFRTAGAGTNPNETDPNGRLEFDRNYYVVRAEVFNMTPATYLWARAQAESNSGLITTYVKELPVRY